MEYDRKVLIPYLTELYGLAVTTNTLNMKKRQLEQIINTEKSNVSQSHKLNEHIEVSAAPMSKGFIGIISLTLTAISCLIIYSLPFMKAIGRGILDFSMDLGIMIIMFSIPFFVAILFPCMYKLTSDIFNKKHYQYDTQVERHNTLEKEKAIIRQSQQLLPQHQKMGAEVSDEFHTCAVMLNDALALNIIPKQYRNLGSIAYLYEYFTTSQATNLDQVIQTMLLDDVRQRIQNIENQLAQIISNQQRLYSKLCDIQYTAEQISAQLTDIELSQKEQLKESQRQTDELKMIKTSARISNYLRAGAYLKMSQYLR